MQGTLALWILMLTDHVVCAWVGKEFPDMRQKEKIEFIRTGDAVKTAGWLLSQASSQFYSLKRKKIPTERMALGEDAMRVPEYPARLLCPWACPGKNTGVGCHFLLQGIFLTQGQNSRLHVSSPALQVDTLPLSHQIGQEAIG